MREAILNGRVVVAGPDSPQVAVCPACGARVEKRQRRRRDGRTTYFYRHARGKGMGCPRRYSMQTAVGSI